jgi:hypothetical protein
MNQIQKLFEVGKTLSFFYLLYIFSFGPVLMNVGILPGLTSRFSKFIKQILPISQQTPPLNWIPVSQPTLVLLMNVFDLVAAIGLFMTPALSAGYALGFVVWRQFLFRYNIDKAMLPDHPLCSVGQSHCATVDAFHLSIIAASMLVFMSTLPLPEQTIHTAKIFNLNVRPVERFVNRIRNLTPQGTRISQQAQVMYNKAEEMIRAARHRVQESVGQGHENVKQRGQETVEGISQRAKNA